LALWQAVSLYVRKVKVLCLSIGGDNLAQYMGREEYMELQYVKK
jgi:hypothetical protein